VGLMSSGVDRVGPCQVFAYMQSCTPVAFDQHFCLPICFDYVLQFFYFATILCFCCFSSHFQIFSWFCFIFLLFVYFLLMMLLFSSAVTLNCVQLQQ